MSNLLKDASILLTPTAYDNGRMLAVKPSDNLYGTELITNGDFTNGVNGWQGTDAASLLSVVLGELKIENGDGSAAGANSSITTEIGKKYRITFVSNKGSAINGIFFGAGTSTNTVNLLNVTDNFDGIHTGTFTATTTTSWFIAKTLSTVNGQFSYIDNVSVKEDLSGDFQFSRNSAATRVNAQGLVENVQILSSNLVSNGNFSQIGTEEVSNGNFSQEGSELITNGDFATDSDWILGTGWSIINGFAKSDGSQSSFSSIYQDYNLTVGKTYKITFNLSDYISGLIRPLLDGTDIGTQYVSSNGNYIFYAKATSSTNKLGVRCDADFIGSIDNVSVKEVGQDWNLGSNWSIGEDKITSNASGLLQQSTSELTPGKTYKTSFEITEYTSGGVKLYSGSGSDTPSYQTSLGTHVVFFVANGSTTSIYSNNFIGSITNISVKEVGQDWTLGSGWSIGEDVANAVNAPFSSQLVDSAILTASKKYSVSFVISNYIQGIVRVAVGNVFSSDVSANGSYTFTLTSANTNAFKVVAMGGGSGTTLSITNIVVKEITDDTNLPRINYEGFSYQDSLGSEDVVNGDFATDTAWNTSYTGISILEGKLSRDATATSSIIQINSAITPSVPYEITFEIVDYTSGTLKPRFGYNGTGGTSVSGVGTYTQIITKVDQNVIELYGTSFIGSIDNVSVKEYLGQEVVPNSGCGSWLMEGQSTNLIPYSEDFSNWSKENVTNASNVTTSPDGTQNADTIIDGGTNTRHINYESFSGNLATERTLSVYAKQNNLRYLFLSVTNSGDSNCYSAIFDLQSGIISATKINGTATNSASMISMGDGWYRCIISGTVTTATATASYFSMIGTSDRSGFTGSLQNNNAPIYTGSGQSIYIYGAMLEQQSYATSYIPTSGAASTRLQDIATNSGNASLINSEEGVLYFEGKRFNNDSANTTISLNNGDYSNSVGFKFRSNENLIFALAYSNSNLEAFMQYTVSDITDFTKIAISYAENNFALWVNGLKVVSDTIGNIPIGLNNLSFAASNSGVEKFFGNTKALAVYKTALTDASLRCLTYPPAVATTFDLNFNTIAEDFTFTRGSEATFVNAQGLIQSTNEIGSELVTNGDFATDSDWNKGTGWSIANGEATHTGGASYLSQSILNPNTQYKVKIKVSQASGSNFVQIYMGGSPASVLIQNVGEYEYIFTSQPSIGLGFALRGAGNVTIDNVSVKEHITATNTPRLDYSTGAEAFLLEPQSTNLITQSEDFSDSSWVKTDCSVVSNFGVSPSGQTNASKLTFTTNNTLARAQYNLGGLTTGNTYTQSYYIKSLGADVTLRIGTSGAIVGEFVDIIATSEWQRFEFTGVASDTTEFPRVQNITSTLGVEILVWGAQLEQQSYATSYIPTSGASATRNQELCNNATPVINSEEGTLYAEISNVSKEDYSNIALTDGTNSQRVQIYFNKDALSLMFFVRVDGVLLATHTVSSSGINYEDTNKIAIKYKTNDISFWLNGIKVGTSTSGTLIPNKFTQLGFNSGSGGAFFGNTKDLKYYPKALADVQLEDLTTI